MTPTTAMRVLCVIHLYGSLGANDIAHMLGKCPHTIRTVCHQMIRAGTLAYDTPALRRRKTGAGEGEYLMLMFRLPKPGEVTSRPDLSRQKAHVSRALRAVRPNGLTPLSGGRLTEQALQSRTELERAWGDAMR